MVVFATLSADWIQQNQDASHTGVPRPTGHALSAVRLREGPQGGSGTPPFFVCPLIKKVLCSSSDFRYSSLKVLFFSFLGDGTMRRAGGD